MGDEPDPILWVDRRKAVLNPSHPILVEVGMKDPPTNKQATPFQKNIIQQISLHLDEDGCCRMTNAALAKICSDVKRIRLHQEIGRLVRSGYLTRELELHREEHYVERKLRITPKVQELMR